MFSLELKVEIMRLQLVLHALIIKYFSSPGLSGSLNAVSFHWNTLRLFSRRQDAPWQPPSSHAPASPPSAGPALAPTEAEQCPDGFYLPCLTPHKFTQIAQSYSVSLTALSQGKPFQSRNSTLSYGLERRKKGQEFPEAGPELKIGKKSITMHWQVGRRSTADTGVKTKWKS